MRLDSVTLCSHMRAAAILGLGCTPKNLKPFQDATDPAPNKPIEWRTGMPGWPTRSTSSCCSAVTEPCTVTSGNWCNSGCRYWWFRPAAATILPALSDCGASGDSLAAWRTFCAEPANVRSIDLGVIMPAESEKLGTRKRGSRYFCCAAGVGLDGEIARRANELPRWMRGHGGYALSLIPALIRFAPSRIKICTLTS